MTFERERIE